MKTKSISKILALVLVLILSFTLFVACANDKDDDNDGGGNTNKPIKPPTVSELLTEMIGYMGNSFVVDNPRKFNIDINTTVKLNDKNSNMWEYEFILKANIDVTKEAKDNDTDFLFEINQIYNKDGEKTKSTIISLLYETEVDAISNEIINNYFYAIVLDSEPFKINGFSLKTIVNQFAKKANIATIETKGSDDIDTIVMILAMIISDGKKVDTNYTFSFNPQDLVNTFGPLLISMVKEPSTLQDLISGLLPEGTEINVVEILAKADKLIAKLTADSGLSFKDVDAEGKEVVLLVDSVYGLLQYVHQNMPSVDIVIDIKFDNNKIFKSASIKADYQAKNDGNIYDDPSHFFEIDIPVAFVGVSGDKINITSNYPLSQEDRHNLVAINLLNANIEGEFIFNSGESKTVYTYEINADLNPFIFFNGVTVENIKHLGYFNLTLNNEKGENTISLYSDFSTGRFLVNFVSPGKALNIMKIELANSYNVEALVGLINLLSPTPEPPTEPEEPAPPTDDTFLKELLDIIIPMFNIEDVHNKGVTIDISDATLNKLFNKLDVVLDINGQTVGEFINEVLFNNSDSVTIKVNEKGAKYGKCEKITEDEVNLVSVGAGQIVMINNPTTDAFQTTYEYGEQFKVNFDSSINASDVAFLINGFDNSGNAIEKYHGIYYTSTFDPYKVGEQNVRVYFGNLSKITFVLKLVNGFIDVPLDPKLPLMGSNFIDVKVNVKPKVNNENTTVDIAGRSSMSLSENIADMLNATLNYDGRSIKVTNDMITSTDGEIFRNSFQKIGNYTIKIKYYSAEAEIPVSVVNLSHNEIINQKFGDNVFTNFDFKLNYINEAGDNILETPSEINLLEVKTAGNSYTWDNDSQRKYFKTVNLDKFFVFEGGVNTGVIAKNQLMVLTPSVVLFFEYSINGVKYNKYVQFKVPFNDKENIKWAVGTAPGIDGSFNKLMKMTKFNTETSKMLTYDVYFNGATSSWIARTSTGIVLDEKFSIAIYKVQEDNSLIEIDVNNEETFKEQGKYIVVGTLTDSGEYLEATYDLGFSAKNAEIKLNSYIKGSLFNLKFNMDKRCPSKPTSVSELSIEIVNGKLEVVFSADKKVLFSAMEGASYNLKILNSEGIDINGTSSLEAGKITETGKFSAQITITYDEKTYECVNNFVVS